jgi:Ni,Fe-hydrogenase maturation factor
MFAAARYPMPVNFLRCSSHQLGIMESIELFRILNILPPHLYIYGIEGKEYDSPFHLSNEVRLSVDLLIAQLVKMIRSPLFRD